MIKNVSNINIENFKQRLGIDELFFDLADVDINKIYIPDNIKDFDPINFRQYASSQSELKDYFFTPFKDTQPATYQLIQQSEVTFFML